MTAKVYANSERGYDKQKNNSTNVMVNKLQVMRNTAATTVLNSR